MLLIQMRTPQRRIRIQARASGKEERQSTGRRYLPDEGAGEGARLVVGEGARLVGG